MYLLGWNDTLVRIWNVGTTWTYVGTRCMNCYRPAPRRERRQARNAFPRRLRKMRGQADVCARCAVLIRPQLDAA